MVNKVILIGNVGADPEIRTFEDGNKAARINLATTERIFNPRTQERSERTDWHRLTIRSGLATVVEQYVRKGSQIYIEGKIRNSEWTDANGQKRYGVEIIVDQLNMLGRKDSSQGQPSQYQQPSVGYPPQQGAYNQPQNQGQQPTSQSGGYAQQNPYQQPQQPQQQYNIPQQQDTPQGMPPYSGVEDNVIDDDLPF